MEVDCRTAEFVTKFLDNVKKEFGRAQKFFISDKAGEYMRELVDYIIGKMDVEHVPIVPHN